MSPMLEEHLKKVEEQANQVLDGFAKPRDALAKNAIRLCELIRRMDLALHAKKSKTPQDFGPLFDGLFGDVFGGRPPK